MDIYYIVVYEDEGYNEVIAECPTKQAAKNAAEQFKQDMGGKCYVHISKCRKVEENGKAVYYAIR